MAIRKIARLGEPILRKPALPIPPEQLGSAWLKQLADDLVATMRDAEGAGLAAPQIYEAVQLCALEVKRNTRYPHFPEIPLTLLVNPQLTPLTANYDVLLENESVTLYEGCLSVPGLRGRVTRPRSVRLCALTLDGREVNEVWTGVAAAILQHEVDHLHGCLFVDRADPLTLCFQQEYERHVPVDQRVIDHAEIIEEQG